MSPAPDPGWFEIVEPVVKGIVREKLEVSLSERDDRRNNQEALDVVQRIYLELAKALSDGSEAVRELKDYAAVVSYHVCADYLRTRYPARTTLKNKIQYFLSHEPGFTLWRAKHDDLYCGYAGWTNRDAATAETVNALKMDPSRIPLKSNASRALGSMKAADWRNLVEGILDFLGGPVELDEVVAIAGSIFRVKDEPGESPFEGSVKPRLDDQIHQHDMMKRLWEILQDFEHRWLMAFLLNLPGYTKEARGEIEAFEESGAATRQQIGRLLGLTEPEYSHMRREILQLPGDPGSAEGRMVTVWPHLPLEDNLIGKALECQKQQVVNLRAVAIQKAAKRLKEKIAEKRKPGK